MKLTKQQRSELRMKFGGRCAYCGCELPEKGWHADHVEAVQREWWKRNPKVSWRMEGDRSVEVIEKQKVGLLCPENDTLENLFPACMPCNIDKHCTSLENWRVIVADKVRILRDNYKAFGHAERFGLVQEVKKPVVFWFETFSPALAELTAWVQGQSDPDWRLDTFTVLDLAKSNRGWKERADALAVSLRDVGETLSDIKSSGISEAAIRDRLSRLLIRITDVGETRRWISVSEGFPEPGTEVLTWNTATTAVHYWNQDVIRIYGVTHWMPLPEPPLSRLSTDTKEPHGEATSTAGSHSVRPANSLCRGGSPAAETENTILDPARRSRDLSRGDAEGSSSDRGKQSA